MNDLICKGIEYVVKAIRNDYKRGKSSETEGE